MKRYPIRRALLWMMPVTIAVVALLCWLPPATALVVNPLLIVVNLLGFIEAHSWHR